MLRLAGGKRPTDGLHAGDVSVEAAYQLVVAADEVIVFVGQPLVPLDEISVSVGAVAIEFEAERGDELFQIGVTLRDPVFHLADLLAQSVDLIFQFVDAPVPELKLAFEVGDLLGVLSLLVHGAKLEHFSATSYQ